MNLRENCPVCGRQRRPHYDYGHGRDLPRWRSAEWFHVICGACADRFMTWFDRTKYSAASGCDLYNPDKSFLVWILKQYKRDIGQVEMHGKPITYCNQSIMNGLVWCRYRADGIVDDGMCGYHRLLLESPEAKAARRAKKAAENAEQERWAQEDLENTILDRLVRHRDEILADEIHDDLNDAFHEIVRLRIRVQDLELAARKPDNGAHDADSIDTEGCEES